MFLGPPVMFPSFFCTQITCFGKSLILSNNKAYDQCIPSCTKCINLSFIRDLTFVLSALTDKPEALDCPSLAMADNTYHALAESIYFTLT